ncbi:MAG: hypothetical protein NW206_02095 [Hyphomonadaceae bacterium]|nr:hypothetical protein [Hyphomonadaceae bacterium]
MQDDQMRRLAPLNRFWTGAVSGLVIIALVAAVTLMFVQWQPGPIPKTDVVDEPPQKEEAQQVAVTGMPDDGCDYLDTAPSESILNRLSQQHVFSEYPSLGQLEGAVISPDFRGEERSAAGYQTRIRRGITGGPNFSGHFTIIRWGCGTGCTDGVVADLSNGRVYDFPAGGERYAYLQAEYRVDSSLLIIAWTNTLDEDFRPIPQTYRGMALRWTGEDFDTLTEIVEPC